MTPRTRIMVSLLFGVAGTACDAEQPRPEADETMVYLGEIETYGGPFVFASWDALASWRGGDILDPSQQTTLHYFGQFTSELPEPFTRDGGHVYVPAVSPEELTWRVAGLRDLVLQQFPGTTAAPTESGFVLTRPDGRTMWILRHPESQYEMACDAGGQDVAWRFPVAAGAADSSDRGVFWVIEGEGWAEIHVAPDVRSVVAVRYWLDDDADAGSLRQRVLAMPAEAGHSLGTLRVDRSGLAALFSACKVGDVQRIPIGGTEIEADALDQFGSRVGIVLPSVRGAFEVRHGQIQDEAGSATWIRFTRE